MSDSEVKMVIVDGVRYRPEDAPSKKKAESKSAKPDEVEAKEAAAPANKSRTAGNK